MIVVTGGAGFIGSRLLKGLNEAGHSNILVVDKLKNGHKFTNLVGKHFVDYMEADDFIARLSANDGSFGKIDAVFHQGACSDTTEWDGAYMMRNNFEFSKKLFNICTSASTPFIYASSAAVYGASTKFEIDLKNEAPLNVYGFSKWQFDQYVRSRKDVQSVVAGLRYFNVYGPGESHKGSMASVAYHLNEQLKKSDKVKLFGEYGGCAPGMQQRDFVFVDDVVKVNIWLWQHAKSGIFNVGSGRAEPFKAIADTVIDFHGRGEIEYIPFPEHLKGHYQCFTQADLSPLRAAGYTDDFLTVNQGVTKYLDEINAS